MLERIRTAAYKLELPAGSRIHDVFHISQLKKALGNHTVVSLPSVCLGKKFDHLIPLDVLAKRFDETGCLELLIRWKDRSSVDDSWLSSKEFVARFPSYKLEGKLGFDGGSIDRYHQAYVRKKKCRGGLKEDDVARDVETLNKRGEPSESLRGFAVGAVNED